MRPWRARVASSSVLEISTDSRRRWDVSLGREVLALRFKAFGLNGDPRWLQLMFGAMIEFDD